MSAKPILGLTMGDPAGIGPEICLRAMREPSVRKICAPVLFGDAGVVERVERKISRMGHMRPIRRMGDRKSTRLNSSHLRLSRMPSSA